MRGGFDGGTDPLLYLGRVLDGYGDPRDYQYLICGVRQRPNGALSPVPRIVVGGPIRAAEMIRDYDDHQEEAHGGLPIFRVEYAGRE